MTTGVHRDGTPTQRPRDGARQSTGTTTKVRAGISPRSWLRALAWLALLAGVGLAIVSSWQWWQTRTMNHVIAELARSVDHPVDSDAAAPLLFARSHYLSRLERFDETAPLIARLLSRDPERAVDALYNRGNGHLRRGIEFVHQTRIDDAIAQVNLAKRDYQQALRLRPDDWQLKYNLDIAMRLVRDFRPAQVEGEDEGEPPERLWTDLPGRPRGMP